MEQKSAKETENFQPTGAVITEKFSFTYWLAVARLIVFSKPIFREENVSFIYGQPRLALAGRTRDRMTASHTSDT